MASLITATSDVEALIAARTLLQKELGKDYKKTGRSLGALTSYVTLYRDAKDATQFKPLVVKSGPCHGSSYNYPSGASEKDIRVGNVSLLNLNNWDKETLLLAHFWLDYLLNESFLKDYFVTKDAQEAIEEGIITYAPDAPVVLVHQCLVAARIPREYIGVATTFKKLVDAGVHRDLAFYMSYMISVDSSGMTRINRSYGHTNLHPDHTNFKNLCKQVFKGNPKKTYGTASEYYGVFAAFGDVTKSNNFEWFYTSVAEVKEHEDIWGDVVRELSLNVFENEAVERLNAAYLKLIK